MKRKLKRYLSQSSDIFNSALLIIPLFLFYQIGILFTGGVRNGVDFVTGLLMSVTDGQLYAYVGLNAVIFCIFLAATWYLSERGKFRPKYYPWMLLESTVYAFFFGNVIIQLMQWLRLDVLLSTAGSLQDMAVFDQLVMSAGAGVYEELVFRLFLVGGAFWLLNKKLSWASWISAVVAVVGSSLVFSAVHHIGPLAEPFALSAFTFRFFAGILFALIFYLRGLAVAVYTHAIYDVIVLVFA